MASPTTPEPARASPRSVIRVAGLNKWYGDFHVLRRIDLEVAEGERVILWGPSGSGKTTLLRCLAGIEPAQSGTMEIAEVSKPVGPWVRGEPTAGVGMVFQSSALFLNMRVIDNVTLGLRHGHKMRRRDAEVAAMHHLAQVRMADFSMRYPGQLSGGQQQRVEIARALSMDPRILLFDEPTAALDPELKHEIAEVIANLASAGRTVVVATHEPALVRALAPRMVLMADGAIVGESTSEAFFARAMP